MVDGGVEGLARSPIRHNVALSKNLSKRFGSGAKLG